MCVYTCMYYKFATCFLHFWSKISAGGKTYLDLRYFHFWSKIRLVSDQHFNSLGTPTAGEQELNYDHAVYMLMESTCRTQNVDR